VASVLLLGSTVNWLAAGLSFAGFAGYVGVYTIWLKRRTPQNIVIGGAAGAVPRLLAGPPRPAISPGPRCPVRDRLLLDAAHFWALSLLMKDEYAKVGVPMMPVVRGEAETRRQILIYSVLLYA